MIVLLGSSHDDILYFESALRDKSKETLLLGKYPMRTGELFMQSVMIVSGVYTSLSASIVVSHIVTTYAPYFIISLGRCKAITEKIKHNTIAISQLVIDADVDQREYVNGKMGQIPGYEQTFSASGDILMIVEKVFDRLFINDYSLCTFLSSETVFSKKEQLENLVKQKTSFGYEGEIVCDSESAGVFATCSALHVPCISIKVANDKVGEEPTIENYISMLGVYSTVGKAIVAFLGEIGRRDLAEAK